MSSINDVAFNGAVNSEAVTEVSFPNGINESLTIPEDKWGASKITIEGVEYVPEAKKMNDNKKYDVYKKHIIFLQ